MSNVSQTCENCRHNGEKHAYDYACDKCTDMDRFQYEDEKKEFSPPVEFNEDLIKRSDAIGACAYETIECYEARKVIRALPPADRPQEWIPCSERMPEYRKTVLISTFWGVKTGFLDSTEVYGDFWEIIEDDATAALHSIYAWMPLPKPWSGRRMKG